MTYAVRAEQARCAALGFWPGPIDGVLGPRTRKARDEAEAFQKERGRPFIHPSGLSRIHGHWSAGAYAPSHLDRKHYHYGIDGEGVVHQFHEPTDKLAHTLNANGGAVGVAFLAMAGAIERPLSVGKFPIRAVQMAAYARLMAELGERFDIPNSRYSMLTHAEVQPTLGIRQKGKIDICWLPGMTAMGSPVEVGDRLRAMIAKVVL